MPIYPNELAMENKPQRLGACFAYAFYCCNTDRPMTIYGRDLMTHAFGPKGPLTDKTAPKGGQDAMRELFARAISRWKNPSSHREVQFEDAGEAVDMICLANQLIRMIERI